MTRPSGKPERLAAAFLLGLALFLPPLLNVASRDQLIGGVPILVLWLFGGWLVLIVILALVVESSPHDDGSAP
ncbi:MAG: hypothetical protein BGO92_00290 [Magnetospirillum sp. 64-120]|nr:MAG: hypothetical protein BGO92_00290 [Magnetospirillum sp. 64-120]